MPGTGHPDRWHTYDDETVVPCGSKPPETTHHRCTTLWYERVSSPDHSGSSLGRGLDQSLKRKRERKRDELEAVHVADLRR